MNHKHKYFAVVNFFPPDWDRNHYVYIMFNKIIPCNKFYFIQTKEISKWQRIKKESGINLSLSNKNIKSYLYTNKNYKIVLIDFKIIDVKYPIYWYDPFDLRPDYYYEATIIKEI